MSPCALQHSVHMTQMALRQAELVSHKTPCRSVRTSEEGQVLQKMENGKEGSRGLSWNRDRHSVHLPEPLLWTAQCMSARGL